MKQRLPFRDKVLPNPEFSSGLTDEFFRFSNNKKLGNWVVRRLHSPGGLFGHELSPEKVAQRQRAFRMYEAMALLGDIRVVPHMDFQAQLDGSSEPGCWQVAQKVKGQSLLDILRTNPQHAAESYRKILNVAGNYLCFALETNQPVIVTDVTKASNFIVDGDGLTLVDTNPPILTTHESSGLESVDIMSKAVALTTMTKGHDFLEDAVMKMSMIDSLGGDTSAAAGVMDAVFNQDTLRLEFSRLALLEQIPIPENL